MKTHLSASTSKQGGSALLVTLVITAIIGTALASYLKLVQYQNRSVVRSQYWNAAMPVSEAGIEEALAHLNKVGDGDRATNGWVLQDGNYYITRTIGNGRYEVWIDSSSQPSITSKGYVYDSSSNNEMQRTVLVRTTKYGSGMRGIITKSGLTMNGTSAIDSFDSSNPLYSTAGRYDPAKAHDMGFAGAVFGNIDTGGGGVWGYIGTGPNGTASANAGDTAWMASNSGIEPGHYAKDLNMAFPDVSAPFSGGALSPLTNQGLTITNYTYLTSQTTSTTYPSPEPASGVSTNYQSVTTVSKPTVWSGTLTTNYANTSSTTYPASGTYVGNVSTRTVVSGKGKKATTTTYYDYTAISGYTYQALTYTYNTVTTNSATTTDNYAYVLDSGNYQMSSISMSGQDQMLVRGDAVLYLTGDFSTSGQAQIVVVPGGSLKLYMGGNLSISGNGILNLTQDATKFAVYGLPSNTSISISGNAAFTGTIYAPNASLSLDGSGTTVYDCIGAVVANSAYFHGHFHFHYDEMLGRVWTEVRFKVAYWTEI